MTLEIKELIFGQLAGQDVTRYVLTNDQQTHISVLSLGGTLQEFVVVEHGNARPLTIGLNTLAEYQANVFSLSQCIGRVAGRIGGAKFDLAGQTYHVDMNEETHSLHGGYHGFSKINYQGTTEQTADAVSVTLTHHIKATDDHYPGNLDLAIKFTLDNENRVTIAFTGQTDAPTLFNPTNHVYWNVTDGQKSIDQQWLKLTGQKRVVVGAEKVPTGQLTPIQGTVYDFNQARDLKSALQELKAETGLSEFDDAYQVVPSLTEPLAEVGDIAGHRRVKIYSDRNGLVIFTSNPVDEAQQNAHQYNTLATEAQTLPDAINHPGFGDTTLQPGRPVTRHIVFQYEQLK